MSQSGWDEPGCWIQPISGEARYEFWSGMHRLGELSRSKSYVGRMYGEFEGERWVFDRDESSPNRFIIHSPFLSRPTITFSGSGDRRGSLLCGDEAFSWSYTHMWLNKWQWNAVDGRALMVFRVVLRPRKREADVHLSEASFKLKQKGLLLCLGWYLLVHSARDGRATAD